MRFSTLASLSFKGQATKYTTVNYGQLEDTENESSNSVSLIVKLVSSGMIVNSN